MNSTMPAPKDATPFKITRNQLKKIAIGLGLYVLFVLYPAFIALHYLYAETLPSTGNMIAIAVCAIGFVFYAYRNMSRLSPPDIATATTKAEETS